PARASTQYQHCGRSSPALGVRLSRLPRHGGPMLRDRTRIALGLAAALELVSSAASAPIPKDLPRGVSEVLYEIAVPPGAEPTPAKLALGDKLSNEKRLSANDQAACPTCHDA